MKVNDKRKAFGDLQRSDEFYQIDNYLSRWRTCIVKEISTSKEIVDITYYMKGDPSWMTRHLTCYKCEYVLKYSNEYIASDKKSALTLMDMVEADVKKKYEATLRTIDTMRDAVKYFK